MAIGISAPRQSKLARKEIHKTNKYNRQLTSVKLPSQFKQCFYISAGHLGLTTQMAGTEDVLARLEPPTEFKIHDSVLLSHKCKLEVFLAAFLDDQPSLGSA
jgi:hypothetical protein